MSELKNKYEHYYHDVSNVDFIDVAMVCDVWGIEDSSGMLQQAVKKILNCGGRGHKDKIKDLSEAIDSIKRKVELLNRLPGIGELK